MRKLIVILIVTLILTLGPEALARDCTTWCCARSLLTGECVQWCTHCWGDVSWEPGRGDWTCPGNQDGGTD